MAEPQYDPNGLGNGAPNSSEATGNLPERFAGMTVEQIVAQYQQHEEETARRMQELEPAQQVFDELQRYGGYDAFKQEYARAYNENQQLRQYLQQAGNQQMSPQQPQNGNSQQGEDWTADWDYRTPQQQAQILAQQVMQQMNQQAESYYNRAVQNLQEQQRQFQSQQERMFDIYRNVIDQQRHDPNLDARELLNETVGLQNAPPDKLMGIAARLLADKSGASQAEIDRLANERFEQLKATWEQEQANRELSSINDGGNAFPFGQFRQGEQNGPPSQQEVERRVMEKALQSGEFNRAHFTG